MRAIPGRSIDALHEIEDRRWRMSFFLKDGGDDLFGLAFRETPLAEEILSLVGVACDDGSRPEEHTSELQSLMRTSYAVFCLKKTIRSTYDSIYSINDQQIVRRRTRYTTT